MLWRRKRNNFGVWGLSCISGGFLTIEEAKGRSGMVCLDLAICRPSVARCLATLGLFIGQLTLPTLPTFEAFSRRPHARCADGSAFPLIFASCATSLTALSHSVVLFTWCVLVDKPLTVEVFHDHLMHNESARNIQANYGLVYLTLQRPVYLTFACCRWRTLEAQQSWMLRP